MPKFFYRKLSGQQREANEKARKCKSGTTITSHRELHCIHDLRFRIDLALVFARIRLSGIIQPESPSVATWRVLGSESCIRAERKTSRREYVQVSASHPRNLPSERQIFTATCLTLFPCILLLRSLLFFRDFQLSNSALSHFSRQMRERDEILRMVNQTNDARGNVEPIEGLFPRSLNDT